MSALRFPCLLLLLGLALAACSPAARYAKAPPDPAPPPAAAKGAEGPALASLRREPRLRIRLAARVREAVFHADGPLRLETAGEALSPRTRRGPLTLRARGTELLLAGPDGSAAPTPATGPIRIAGTSGTVRFGGRAYPGHLLALPAGGGRLNVVNEVPLETYLPGVLAGEVYAAWPEATLDAQAIAARSYALWERAAARDAGRAWDLEAGTASQAYLGRSPSPHLVAAVRRTRGRVLAYQGRVLPAFYSATCGGVGQTAAAVIERAPELAPLAGRERGTWCDASPHYRWPTVRRRAGALARAMADWGRRHAHPLAELEGLRTIWIRNRNPAGRPIRFRILDRRGRRFTVNAETLRFAANHVPEGAEPLPRNKQLKSSHVEPSITGQTVVFRGGRGHGHGAGLCQWGAHGLAVAGRDTRQILGHYYPGASLAKIY